MDILLINLPRYNSVPVVREERCEFLSKNRVDTPATLLIMAALLREMGNKIDFIDANALNLSYEDILDRVKNEKIRMRKVLYFNPKWWLTCIKTIIWNRHLILPTIGLLLRRRLAPKLSVEN